MARRRHRRADWLDRGRRRHPASARGHGYNRTAHPRPSDCHADRIHQLRAILSDGHVDYTVVRTLPYLPSYESPATRRRLRLLSGVTDFAQARTAFSLFTGASQEAQYVAVVERGQVIVPPAVEIADGRRTAAGIHWPDGGGEASLMPTMPIVRTTADALYYLDGRAIRDPQGNALVLP